ncbi:hypothetical protein [Lentzea jiangxiensis]|uniref:hypothetical protein n=1 Tax=Lentzea jiangxiensis TaxID=641025 RepID=UPI00115FC538|nr:hypothetical protein [Lentzea jiangxiensis]
MQLTSFACASDLDELRNLHVNYMSQAVEKAEKLRSAALLSGRVCLLICDEIDILRASGKNLGATHDTSIYASCVRELARSEPASGGVEDDLKNLVEVANRVADFLADIGLLDVFVDHVAGLLNIDAIRSEVDDLLLHRCLHVWYMFSETYLRGLLASLDPAVHVDGSGAAGYEKGNVNQTVLDCATGPPLGHNQYLSPLVATCFSPEMSLRAGFLSYADSIITYMPDWESLPRDRGISSSITSAFGEAVERGRRDFSGSDDPEWIWLRRNSIGNLSLRWFANLDSAVTSANASLLHTGILCNLSESIRKASMISLGYGQFGLWPVPRLLSLPDYGRYGSAALGEMLRGWTSDHDSEAAIGEHSPLNWLCVDCATVASRDCMSRDNALGLRAPWEARIAWAPHPFNFLGGRHQGLRRRTDSIRARTDLPAVAVTRAAPISCTPIEADDQINIVVTKLLALVGLSPEPGLVGRLDMQGWGIEPRVCAECDFAGRRAQMFMLSVGCARLGALLPDELMKSWTQLVEKYAYRLFPAVQVRLLVQCDCVPLWVADVLTGGYEDAGTSCGLSPCLASRNPMPSTVMWDHPDEDEQYDETLLRKRLLDQAAIEARSYAEIMVKNDWLSVVTQPISNL